MFKIIRRFTRALPSEVFVTFFVLQTDDGYEWFARAKGSMGLNRSEFNKSRDSIWINLSDLEAELEAWWRSKQPQSFKFSSCCEAIDETTLDPEYLSTGPRRHQMVGPNTESETI